MKKENIMKSSRLKECILYFTSLFFLFPVITGCTSARLIEYSSTAGQEQKASLVRTEMLIIQGDDEKIKRNYFVVSAVDYPQDAKKNYYLIIVPAIGAMTYPKVDDLLLSYNYPFVIQGSGVSDLIANLEKISAEWDSKELKYSGAVYNFFLTSPQNTHPVFIDNRSFEITPFIKFNYSKTENGAMGKLSLGNRMEEIINSTVDGKTIKTRLFVQDDEQNWIFDQSDQMKDFLNLLKKGLMDLKVKGMEGISKKTDVTETKPAEEKVQKRAPKRKKK